MWRFGEETTLEFANTSTLYAANTLKLQIDINSWPFRALANFLEIVIDSSSTDPAQTTCVLNQTDESSGLRWLLVVVVGGVSLYLFFPPLSPYSLPIFLPISL
jgi:hypothetical protein